MFNQYEAGRIEAVNDLQKRQYDLLYKMRSNINAIMCEKCKFYMDEHQKLLDHAAEYEENRREIQRLTNEVNLIRALRG